MPSTVASTPPPSQYSSAAGYQSSPPMWPGPLRTATDPTTIPPPPSDPTPLPPPESVPRWPGGRAASRAATTAPTVTGPDRGDGTGRGGGGGAPSLGSLLPLGCGLILTIAK